MKNLFIDADGFPRLASEWLESEAVRLKLGLYLAANHFNTTANYGRQIVTANQKESADDYIAAHAVKGDVVFTLDLPLAERLEAQGVLVINHLGEQLKGELLKKKLLERKIMLNLGGAEKNFRPKLKNYGPAELEKFKAGLKAVNFY